MSKNKTEIIFGFHAVESVIKNDPVNLLECWVDPHRHDKRIKELLSQVEKQGVSIEYVKKADLEKRCGSQRTQGIAARYRSLKAPQQSLDDLLEKDNVLLLVLDGIQDPHNLGACLRTADAAGVDAVIAPKDRAASITPTVRKVASGAAESIPFIQVTNLARTLKQLKDADVWIVGTAGEAEAEIYDVDLKGKLAIIMGAEEKGMRRLTRENCDQLIKLPMAGQVESLNVSVATGVCLFEAVRQRR
ncbi:MAG: 23S rRNA (guanosine(2251)-2'-O)-methyltransferase RlmB [Gammaproteobacteria bacterium]|nr:23S rRNA (guanosine(2251)-2'-O)-methyltransferase RlmB [Gammaproteobacteria bacterium]MCW8909847.1 23S rRNA (guanosine(2251)-2'-O)-methyltransferase RlmB [Gammaproteobacteria bacterium]MCW9006011.1 23S rRNA (guanosine(2251)-2'-O)-methyltransferase RlmB [Gammaproteobacteria bacterium]MCW9055651.1 23S rRNA (guanosine(2251)-2'-O)-methyltransferase RlmB [Gammaproteobacteria bacterium]